MNKDLRSMTVKEIKAYMQENNIKITGAYKMKKAELIEAIEIIESVDEKINSMKLKTYKADYEDENFVVITAYSDEEAVDEAFSYENEHGALFNLFEVDDNYDAIREVRIDDFYNTEITIETEETKPLKNTDTESEEYQKVKSDFSQALEILGKNEFKKNIDWAKKEVAEAKRQLETIKYVCSNPEEIKKYEDVLRYKEKLRDAMIAALKESNKVKSSKKQPYIAPPVIDISTLYTCKFKLGGADEDTSRWDESDAEYFEMDLRYFDSFIDKLDAKYDDRLDKIDDYRYTVSNLSDDELGELESLFNELENDMDYCWIQYDFIEVEAA